LSTRLKTALRTYANRTTPWGAPWWVYVVTIGAANLLRQMVMPDDVATETQAATFMTMVVGVAAVVTGAYLGLARLRRERRQRPGVTDGS
jgi:hypothetical protein